jgi:hypothetical protein
VRQFVPLSITGFFSGGFTYGEAITMHGSIVMAKGRLCVSFNPLIFGRVFLEVSFLASFSFVGASDLSLYVFQSSCVSPYIITPPVSTSRELYNVLRIYIFFKACAFASLLPARH